MSRPHVQPESVSEVLVGRERLEAVVPEWRRLWADAPQAGAFQSPEWLMPWCLHLGPADPVILRVRRFGRTVGLAFFSRWVREDGTRIVSLLGAGVTDRLGVLARPGSRRAVGRAVAGWLADTSRHWDVCELEELSEGSLLLDMRLPRAWRDEVSLQSVRPVLRLPRGGRTLADAVPASRAREWRYCVRRAGRDAPLGFERAGADDFGVHLELLFLLHGAAWRDRGEAGVLAEPRTRRFHRAVAEGFARAGRLHLVTVRLGGRVVASAYGLADRETLHYYLGGFDPAVKRLSPGTLAIGALIEGALRRGLRAVDFLRGEEPYKYRWGATDRPNLRRRIEH